MREHSVKILIFFAVVLFVVVYNWRWFSTAGVQMIISPVRGPVTGILIAPKPTGTVSTTSLDSKAEKLFVVTRVVDGDTIEIESGEKVRYIGINTPESVDPRRPVECFGKEASEYNNSLVEGKQVRLVKDVTETDKYGRLLRYVYLEDGTFVNLKLVKDGYASVMTIPPNIKYSKEFVMAEQEARAAGKGLWSKCN